MVFRERNMGGATCLPSIGCLLRAPRRGSSPQPGMSPGPAGGLSSQITPALDTLPGPAASPQEAFWHERACAGTRAAHGPPSVLAAEVPGPGPPACPPCGTGLLTLVPPAPWVPALMVGSPETAFGWSHGGRGGLGLWAPVWPVVSVPPCSTFGDETGWDGGAHGGPRAQVVTGFGPGPARLRGAELWAWGATLSPLALL